MYKKISAFDFFQYATFLLIYCIVFGNLCVCPRVCVPTCVQVYVGLCVSAVVKKGPWFVLLYHSLPFSF